MKKYLEIGQITKIQGLKGEFRVRYCCDSAEMIGEFETLYLSGRGGKDYTEVSPSYSRSLKNDVAVVKLEGVDTAEQAEKLIGRTLYFDREDVELPEDTWFISDLIGLSVIDADSGRVYGKVDDIYQNGGADVYSLKTPDGRQLMFPAIPEVLLSTDINAGTIVIRPLKGLFEDAEEISGQ